MTVLQRGAGSSARGASGDREARRDARRDLTTGAARRIVHEVPRDLQQLYAGKLNLDLASVNGEWTLPMPARFVIDRGGIVRSVETDPDYRDRPDPSSTLEALGRLRGGS